MSRADGIRGDWGHELGEHGRGGLVSPRGDRGGSAGLNRAVSAAEKKYIYRCIEERKIIITDS